MLSNVFTLNALFLMLSCVSINTTVMELWAGRTYPSSLFEGNLNGGSKHHLDEEGKSDTPTLWPRRVAKGFCTMKPKVVKMVTNGAEEATHSEKHHGRRVVPVDADIGIIFRRRPSYVEPLFVAGVF